MTQEMIRGLSDVELQQAIVWAADEQKARAAKRKQETIAKIKALAAQAGVTIAIEGMRGRRSNLHNKGDLKRPVRN